MVGAIFLELTRRHPGVDQLEISFKKTTPGSINSKFHLKIGSLNMAGNVDSNKFDRQHVQVNIAFNSIWQGRIDQVMRE